MTYEEYLQEQKKKKSRRPPRAEEHRLQCGCVSWFCLQYPAWRGLLFAVPNGGRRDGITGKKLKDEGVVPESPTSCCSTPPGNTTPSASR